jgi:acyl-CoA reductase-like NAD-dependent aldehyde dehydrogenase
MASVITAELGMPVQWCRSVQVDGPIIGLEHYVELAGLMDEVREVGNSLVIREAVGVCAFINPWNYPLHQLIGKLAPALAAGCTVVVKPSQETPLHAFLLAQMIEAIGLPAGVFNLVSGPGSKVGEALAKHPDVDMVSFTGSTGAGVRVAQAAAPSVKRVCLELGGKSPLLIAEDADLAAAVRYGVQDVMINSGQTCTALTRMLLPASRYAEAVELAIAETRNLRMGDPLDPNSFLGPMCSAAQRRTVLDYIKVGQQEGARLVYGGDTAGEFERGFYVTPTLFADVDNRMRIAQEEIFGPVLCLIPYTDEAQAIQIANDSPFGLSSGVWAGSAERALQLGRQLRAGQCFLNGAVFNYQAPFGGYKQSGNGREWGEEGLNEFVEVKAIQV